MSVTMEPAKLNKSSIIREILKNDPGATYGDHKAHLEGLGISTGFFSNIKSKMSAGNDPAPTTEKKERKARQPKTTVEAIPQTVDIGAAIKFVKGCGGVAQAREHVKTLYSYVKAVEAVLSLG